MKHDRTQPEIEEMQTAQDIQRDREAACDLPRDLLITVCAACLQASCWQGKFYCQEFKTADIVDLPVSRLLELGREHPDYWNHDPRAEDWRINGIKQRPTRLSGGL